MIYNVQMHEHLAYISKEEYFEKQKAKSGIMSGPFGDEVKYACPHCLSSKISPSDRKKECGFCSGKGVVWVQMI